MILTKMIFQLGATLAIDDDDFYFESEKGLSK